MPDQDDDIDRELAEVFSPVDPEVFFRLGQERPGVSLSEALSELHKREVPPGYAGQPTLKGEGSGGLTPEEVAEIRAEQDPLLLGARSEVRAQASTSRGQRHIGFIEELAHVYFYPLDSFESLGGPQRMRDSHGRRMTFTVQEQGVMAFLSGVIQLARTVPDWISMVVFASEPQGFSMHGECLRETVRFIIGFTREEPEGRPSLPEWILARGHSDVGHRERPERSKDVL
jgi:hypothetical protein